MDSARKLQDFLCDLSAHTVMQSYPRSARLYTSNLSRTVFGFIASAEDSCRTPLPQCRKISRAAELLEKLRRVSVKIVLWRTEIAVELCDNFAHLRHMSSLRGTDVS